MTTETRQIDLVKLFEENARNVQFLGPSPIRIADMLAIAEELKRARQIIEFLESAKVHEAPEGLVFVEEGKLEALEDALLMALPFVEDHEDDIGYKPGVVTSAVRKIKKALSV